MDSKEPGGNMSEIREAVRSRYADAAKKIAVLQPEPGVGCCQVDGPDCGCAGSYAAEDLQQIGMSDAVSLGCGNPTMLADLKPGEVVLTSVRARAWTCSSRPSGSRQEAVLTAWT